ncbi:MAG: hypothetical protein H6P98_2632 [Candidatus Aminicenantes bacterium]|jgi:hypothetical protein|nr:hypothetical protein [Candidatus Aminicenantes bacterium]
MSDFFEAKSLTPEDQKKLAAEIESRIAARLADGLLTEKDIREIEEMRLRPLPDIQDVQNVYENHLFKAKPE